MITLLIWPGAVNSLPSILLYADPGSGILIWQLATAAALGLAFYARSFFRKIRLLRQTRQNKEDHEQTSTER